MTVLGIYFLYIGEKLNSRDILKPWERRSFEEKSTDPEFGCVGGARGAGRVGKR
jgi:hypothetical protein